MGIDLSFPRRIYAEMYLSGAWRPVGQHVMQSPDITITRGTPDEGSDPPPAVCTFTLNDSADKGNGAYNPYNPMGQWYGQLTRNVPVRLGLKAGEDAFTRTVASGWGTSPSNGAWTAFTAGGTVATSVASNTGRHSITSTNATALTYISDAKIRDVEVALSVTITSVSDVLGAGLGFGEIVLRGQNSTTYYLCNVEVNSAETVSLKFVKVTPTGAVAIGQVYQTTGYTGQQWRIKAQAEGRTLRAKVWHAADAEPLDWHVTAIDPDPLPAGFVGVLSAVLTGNTNTKPVVFAYDDLEIRVPRFEGETTRMSPFGDSTMKLRTTSVRASDITQRLSQGKSPVVSSMRYSIAAGAAAANIVAYWPMEEQSYATSIAPAVGPNPMQVLRGRLNAGFGSDDTFPGSLPIPAIGTTEFRAVVPPHTITGEYVIRTLLNIPGGQDDTAIFVLEMITTGTASKWQIQLEQDGSLSVRCFGGLSGLLLDDIGNPVITDLPLLFTFDVWQNGADINYISHYWSLDDPDTQVSVASGTVTGQTLGTATRIGVIGGVPNLGFPGPSNTGVGHLYLATIFTGDPAHDAFPGHDGEKLFDRVNRITTIENGQKLVSDLYASTTADDTMGPQRPDTLLNLMRECARTDHGVLFTPKGDRTLALRRLDSLYDQIPLTTLDYSTGVFQPGFQPVNDDFNPRNDVTVNRRDGGSAQAVREDGPNNALDPGTADGAVGRYDTTYTVNCETDDQAAYSAGWLLNVGTVDDPRFPDIPIELSGNALRGSADAQGALLDAGPGDVLELTNLQKWGIYEPSRQLVLGYTERFNTVFRHLIAYNAVPADPYRVGKLDDAYTATGQGTAITNEYLVASDADAADIAIGAKVYLKLSTGALKQSTIFTVTSKDSSSGFTNIHFTPNAATPTVATNYLEVVTSLRLDLDSTLAEDLDTTETGVDVTTSDPFGTLWATSAALPFEFPFDVMCEGERMTVTACTGSSNPQTMTVTRSVNGVIKTHLTGAKLSLADPYYVAR